MSKSNIILIVLYFITVGFFIFQHNKNKNQLILDDRKNDRMIYSDNAIIIKDSLNHVRSIEYHDSIFIYSDIYTNER